MSAEFSEICPFKVGDIVVYAPSQMGLAAEAMALVSERLIPNQAYRVAEIRAAAYVVVEGYKHAGGGLFWTEFRLADTGSGSVWIFEHSGNGEGCGAQEFNSAR